VQNSANSKWVTN